MLTTIQELEREIDQSKSFFYCGCGKLNCWNGRARVVTCSWCGNRGRLSGGIDSINITGDF